MPIPIPIVLHSMRSYRLQADYKKIIYRSASECIGRDRPDVAELEWRIAAGPGVEAA